MSILTAAAIGLIGGLAYLLSENAKIAELGRIAFFCGLFALVLSVNGQSITLFR